jgi:hypothetical protein
MVQDVIETVAPDIRAFRDAIRGCRSQFLSGEEERQQGTFQEELCQRGISLAAIASRLFDLG